MKSNKHTQLKEREKQRALQGQSVFPGKVETMKEYAKYPVIRKHV